MPRQLIVTFADVPHGSKPNYVPNWSSQQHNVIPNGLQNYGQPDIWFIDQDISKKCKGRRRIARYYLQAGIFEHEKHLRTFLIDDNFQTYSVYDNEQPVMSLDPNNVNIMPSNFGMTVGGIRIEDKFNPVPHPWNKRPRILVFRRMGVHTFPTKDDSDALRVTKKRRRMDESLVESPIRVHGPPETVDSVDFPIENERKRRRLVYSPNRKRCDALVL